MSRAALKKAQDYCKDNQERYTAPRSAVLSIILSSSKPLGAYDILKQLGEFIEDPKPPTAYRAIEFWQTHGFIHRIESLNAYVACQAGHQHKGSQFMICEGCGDVKETHFCTLPQSFQKSLADNSFEPARWNLEIHGVCAACSV